MAKLSLFGLDISISSRVRRAKRDISNAKETTSQHAGKTGSPHAVSLGQWTKLPIELRQKIFHDILDDSLPIPPQSGKVHVASFRHAVHTTLALEGLHSTALLYPLQQFQIRLHPEVEATQAVIAQISKDLSSIWIRWSHYSLTAAPDSLQAEAVATELRMYRAQQQLKTLEDIEQTLLSSLQLVHALSPADRTRLKYLKRRKWSLDWKPVMLRREDLLKALCPNGSAQLVKARAEPCRSVQAAQQLPVARVCRQCQQLDSLGMSSAFRVLVDACRPQRHSYFCLPYMPVL